MQTGFHKAHYGLFTGPHEANWIRKMSDELDADIFKDDINIEGMIELASILTAEVGASVAVFGVGVEIGEEDLEKVPVAVYYYTMLDTGRTHLDPLCIEPGRPGETIVELPEWFPCQKTNGSIP